MSLLIILIIDLDTFGVQLVNITDTTGNRVCLQCVFSSFSSDSGCTVELVDSSTTLVHYSTVFNRSTNIAEGCITDVTSGLYDIRVYDQGSNVVVASLVVLVQYTTVYPSISTYDSSATLHVTTILMTTTPGWLNCFGTSKTYLHLFINIYRIDYISILIVTKNQV